MAVQGQGISIPEDPAFAKHLERALIDHFCKEVDPILILRAVNLRMGHEQKIRRQVQLKSDSDVNMQLWGFLKQEPDWMNKLYRALKRNEYHFLVDRFESVVEQWKNNQKK